MPVGDYSFHRTQEAERRRQEEAERRRRGSANRYYNPDDRTLWDE